MTILVCPLSKVTALIQSRAPERIVSLLDPGRAFPDAGPRANEHTIALTLRKTAPLSRPNQTLIELADAALGRRGRMCEAIADTVRGLSWVEVEAALRVTGEGIPFELQSEFGAS